MKYFTVSEMLYSPTAVKRGIWNGCDREKEDNLEALVDNVLDPVRTRYGKAVHVSSGYRCEQLNKLIHGALGSQHLRGEAADIYTDIILDVSAIPCAYYYNIAKLLYDKTQYDQSNFFITVSENVEIDKLIKKKYNEETITPLYNFRALYGMESIFNPINIFVPLMGEDKKEHLKLVYDTFHPKEVCPVLPFPSKEPGRSDQLLWEYNDFLTDTLKVEPQNLLYAPERDPFELYNRLEKLMQDYKDTLKLIDGQICFGFALLTSKLLALGVLLIGLKYENEVQVYNVNSSKYDIADKNRIIEANEHSEPFLMWINGEPYV